MAKWKHTACPQCGSSDALSYTDGDTWGKCFSCGKSSPLNPNEETKMSKKPDQETSRETLDAIAGYPSRGFQERGITKVVSEHYGVKVTYDSDGSISSHFYPYTANGQVVAYKERKLPKTFAIHGALDMNGTVAKVV